MDPMVGPTEEMAPSGNSSPGWLASENPEAKLECQCGKIALGAPASHPDGGKFALIGRKASPKGNDRFAGPRGDLAGCAC